MPIPLQKENSAEKYINVKFKKKILELFTLFLYTYPGIYRAPIGSLWDGKKFLVVMDQFTCPKIGPDEYIGCIIK